MCPTGVGAGDTGVTEVIASLTGGVAGPLRVLGGHRR